MRKLYSYIHKAKNSPRQLWILNQFLKLAIPFNRPHHFKVTKIDETSVTTHAPYRKKNFNHLKGIHACAIATVAELSAGLCLMNHFSPLQYRFIMSHLEIDYHYQAKTAIYAKSVLTEAELIQLLLDLKNSDKVFHEITTLVEDENLQSIATVKTTWQIKDWKQVKTKV